MWQSGSYRRALADAAKKREASKRKTPRHLKRVAAQIKVLGMPGSEVDPTSNTVILGRLVLNDIGPRVVDLFGVKPILVGCEVSITIEHPRRFYCKGKVVACQELISDSHILSQNSFSYRMTIEYLFEDAEEQKAVREFYEEIHHEYILGETKPLARAPAPEAEAAPVPVEESPEAEAPVSEESEENAA